MSDVDYLKFTPSTSGKYSILVGRDTPSSVDLTLQIEDGSGDILASEDGDPTEDDPQRNVYDQHLTVSLSAGTTYYIQVHER